MTRVFSIIINIEVDEGNKTEQQILDAISNLEAILEATANRHEIVAAIYDTSNEELFGG